MTSSSDAPLFKVGLCTDLQWADVEDGYSSQGESRYYRNALKLFKTAFESFKKQDVAFAMHLGDIVDKKQQEAYPSSSAELNSALGLKPVVESIAAFGKRCYHVVGNHCLYNFSRPELYRWLDMDPAPEAKGLGYYSLCPHDGWRFIVLDSYDVSVLGWPVDSPEFAKNYATLEKNNTSGDVYSPHGEGSSRRWVGFGGGISKEQLQWLRAELRSANSAGQRVLVFCHCTLHPEAVGDRLSSLTWNYDEILEAIWEAGNVVATFAGHIHHQYLHRDEHGVHHSTLPALLQAPPSASACHAIMDVRENRIEVRGFGETFQSYSIPFQ